ncbi:hypothetical protein TYRP_019717 [Tyrophagus putrescentiae]|nr:hypothetical protein TYRP_019717 [Tyrophagus putrescentiae]
MSLRSSNFDLIFADADVLELQRCQCIIIIISSAAGSECFHIIRNILSMLNGVNAETVRKNPNDIFMLLRYGSAEGNQQHQQQPNNTNFVFHCELSDQFCQLIIRIGSLGKLLLKILNYLNYYSLKRSADSRTTYPMFDEALSGTSALYGKSTLGNIKQYFVNSAHQEIKLYHYHLLMIEANHNPNANVHFALRRILLWTDEWLAKFLFLADLLKACLDLKGVSLLNAVHDHSQHGDPMVRQLARGVLHQTLKPFIGNVFDWLLTGEVQLDIGVDFFIRKKEKETLLDIVPPKAVAEEEEAFGASSTQQDPEQFEWRLYTVNECQLPSFLSRLSLRKIFLIGNAVRLLRYMLREEYDAKYATELFTHSPIMASYETLKRFVYKQLDSYGGGGGSNDSTGETETVLGQSIHPRQQHQQQQQQQPSEESKFFFEHPLVDEFDLLLDAYYEVINEEVFRLLAMTELSAQFETQLGYVLMQRGDFYESLIDYLLPLLRKPAAEVVNIVSANGGHQGTSSSSSSGNSLHQIFNMFLVNAKLIELAQVYRIDSLLCGGDQSFLDSLVFSFASRPPPLKHHLGWDIFTTRYRFTKNVYAVLFEASSVRYSRLFRSLFQFPPRPLRHSRHPAPGHLLPEAIQPPPPALCLLQQAGQAGPPATSPPALPPLSPVWLHQSHVPALWLADCLALELRLCPPAAEEGGGGGGGKRQQTIGSIEKLVRAHERFLSSIEAIVFFGRSHSMIAAFAAVNDSVVDFCEAFAETELFPTLQAMIDSEESDDFEELQAIAESLFRHQFKVSIVISKYRCTVGNFISLAAAASSEEEASASLQFKYDIRNYGPCLDHLFSCHTKRSGRGEQDNTF